MSGLLELLKQIPLDLGQGSMAERTMGKVIAMDLVPAGDGAWALDIGARRGHQTRWLQSRGYQVISGDVEPGFEGCQVLDANAPLPFEDGRFRLIWCSEVLEHLKDPAFSLGEMLRVTAPGGHVVLTTPNSYAWFFRMAAWVGLPPSRLQRADHLHFFDEAAIRRLAPEAEVFGFFPYAFVRRKIRRGIGLLSPTFVIHLRK